MRLRKGFTLIELPVVRKRAFTLIELLVVIAIIAILATIVIINVAGARTKAQDAKVMDDIAVIARGAEVARVEMGSLFPTVAVSALEPGRGIITYLPVEKTFAAETPQATAPYNDTLHLLKDSNNNPLIGSNPKHPISGEYYIFHSVSDGYYAISGRLARKDPYDNPMSRVQTVGHSGVNIIGTPMQAGEKGDISDECYEYYLKNPYSKTNDSKNYVLGNDIHAIAGEPIGGEVIGMDCTVSN